MRQVMLPFFEPKAVMEAIQERPRVRSSSSRRWCRWSWTTRTSRSTT
ncbi:hypothetical protein ACU686_40205 [Yinghuangia aomiensis]